MGHFVEFELGDGQTVVVEVEDNAAGVVPAGIRAGQVARKAAEGFDEALDRLTPAVATVLQRIRDLAESPSEVVVTFGIKMSADLGAVVAQMGGEANFGVTLKWERGIG